MSRSWINLCTDVAVQIVSGGAATGGDILDGLALIQNRCYDGVLIQIDSLEVVKAIQDSFLSSLNSALIRGIHHLLLKARSWGIQHFPKDCNKTADCLAKIAIDTNQKLMIFYEILR
ncbi:hypothetical protein Goklo_011837, partial [Gossypium klotzschianum]|nr:hypothetical protein [Gossypium klotzschianum]